MMGFNPKPKPTKQERVKAKADRHKDLVSYRRTQSALAISRDNDQCVICWFKHKRVRPRAEIHHVYSRGRKAGDWREQYRSLMCVCKECHPLPVQVPGASVHLGWVEDILKMANDTPINNEFRHQ